MKHEIIEKLLPNHIDELNKIELCDNGERLGFNLKNAVDSKNAIAVILKKNNIEQAIAVYEKQDDELIILGAKTLTEIPIGVSTRFEILDVGIQIAKKLNLKKISFETIRQGLVQSAIRQDFKISKIKMTKEIK